MSMNVEQNNAAVQPQKRNYRSSISGQIVGDAIWGAALAGGVSFAFNPKRDEFIKKGAEIAGKESYESHVKALKEKIKTLPKESKELTRAEKKLAFLEKQGSKAYANQTLQHTYANLKAGKYEAVEKNTKLGKTLGDLFDAKKAKTLTGETLEKAKEIYKKTRLSNTSRGAMMGALICGACGLIMGVAFKATQHTQKTQQAQQSHNA